MKSKDLAQIGGVFLAVIIIVGLLFNYGEKLPLIEQSREGWTD